jgi:hypothetical protein
MDDATKLYNDLLEASKAQIETNIKSHKLRTSRIQRGVTQRQALQLSLPKVPLDLLAIGDSWFEYPLYDNGPLIEQTAIVAQTQLGSIGNPPPKILNMALHGQATTAMLSYENQEKMIAVLQDPDQWLNQNTKLPDAILVSAGGDDIAGDQFAIYLDYGGTGGLNAARFEGVLDSVQASYADLFAFRDIFAKGVPIIGHCYDYAIPNGIHPICVSTGWLQPSLDFAGYDYSQGLGIVSVMIDKFHDMLNTLAMNPANNFMLVDTRNTITRDSSVPNGWANEIHPRFSGFTALANKFLAALRAKFPNRV